MRIIHWSGLPAVVLVKGRGVCAVAVPETLASREVLELASLVLSPTEYREFQHEVGPTDGEVPKRYGPAQRRAGSGVGEQHRSGA